MDIKDRLLEHKIVLNDVVFENIKIYKEHLFKWNKTHNLTGVKNESQLDDFIVDSLIPISFLPKVKNILDIGTGAGFPGLILAMAMHNTEFTLVEPMSKRASFLQFIKATLKLDNVSVKNKRVEELEPELFELVTSRAVTQTQMLMSLSEPFLSKGSILLFYKGEKVYEEIDESLNCRIIQAKNRHYLLIEV
ncbi:MAG: 16S rRNA (guanine(527)-N(7))-methyltransferase RsmG [Campylobacterota bacterium]|nr:16S rRNA (guanine(527)-N(7))-methyltransferase RsmG [Campylobacterota bacterium]